MRVISLLALAVVIGWCPMAITQTLPQGMTMHRTHAGVLDASGWSLATSTWGGFAVKLPCVFNDFNVKGNASEPVSSIDTVGCLREDQRKFSASRFSYAHGAQAAREYFEQMPHRTNFDGETFRGSLSFNGLPAFQVNFQNSTRCGTIRAVLAGATLFMLTAEAPRSACDGLAQEASSFFSTLSVSSRAPNKTMEPTR